MVLLIDDDDIINFLNRKLIEKSEIAENVRVLKNGLEGINYFSLLCQLDACPELIFLDLNMPIMNGFQFLEACRELPYKSKVNTKIIVLSSSEDPNDIKKAHALGCDDYLSKPLNKVQIKRVMEKYFNLVE